jgi:hypothetical protein
VKVRFRCTNLVDPSYQVVGQTGAAGTNKAIFHREKENVILTLKLTGKINPWLYTGPSCIV